MSMTKKDYIAMANIIRKVRKSHNYNSDGITAADEIACGLAIIFKNDNQRFDRDIFLAACK